jgi:thioredoxin 1
MKKFDNNKLQNDESNNKQMNNYIFTKPDFLFKDEKQIEHKKITIPQIIELIHVTDETFEDEVVNCSKVVLLDCWAQWCGPCQKLTPILQEIQNELSYLKIVKMDVDENEYIPNQLNASSIPALYLFYHGKVISTLNGYNSKDKLIIWIKQNIQSL